MESTIKQTIRAFINNVSANNYADANKDLKKVVEYKTQQRIARAAKKNLF